MTLLEEAQALFEALNPYGVGPGKVDDRGEIECLVCRCDVYKSPHNSDCTWVTVVPKIITTLKLLEDIVRPVNRLQKYLAAQEQKHTMSGEEYTEILESMAKTS